MKRTVTLLMVVVAFGLMFMGCGSKTVDIPKQQVEASECPFEGQEIIRETNRTDDPPEWVFGEKPWRGVDEISGEPVMFFFGKGRSTSESMADRSARGNAAAAAAESIVKKVISQFAEAMESWGQGAEEEIEQVRMSLTAFKAKVKVVGERDAGSYSYQVEVIDEVENCAVAKSHAEWAVALRQAISYADYQKMRDEAFGDAMGSSSGPNERQAEMLEKAEEAMAELDAFDSESGSFSNGSNYY